jgi:hypothetical protein
MTRFADAFQLPLERTNVFAPPKKEKEAKKDEKKEPAKKRKIDEGR